MQKRALQHLAAAAATTLALGGCGFGGSPAAPTDGAAAQDLATAGGDLSAMTGPTDLAMSPADLATAASDLFGPRDLGAAPYPPGPYGNTVGSVIPNLAWVGYEDDAGDAVATTKPYAAYAMLDLHRSGRPYGMVHISEVY